MIIEENVQMKAPASTCPMDLNCSMRITIGILPYNPPVQGWRGWPTYKIAYDLVYCMLYSNFQVRLKAQLIMRITQAHRWQRRLCDRWQSSFWPAIRSSPHLRTFA